MHPGAPQVSLSLTQPPQYVSHCMPGWLLGPAPRAGRHCMPGWDAPLRHLSPSRPGQWTIGRWGQKCQLGTTALLLFVSPATALPILGCTLQAAGMAASRAPAETEAALISELQGEYAGLEAARKSYSEESQAVIREQKLLIASLGEENTVSAA